MSFIRMFQINHPQALTGNCYVFLRTSHVALTPSNIASEVLFQQLDAKGSNLLSSMQIYLTKLMIPLMENSLVSSTHVSLRKVTFIDLRSRILSWIFPLTDSCLYCWLVDDLPCCYSRLILHFRNQLSAVVGTGTSAHHVKRLNHLPTAPMFTKYIYHSWCSPIRHHYPIVIVVDMLTTVMPKGQLLLRCTPSWCDPTAANQSINNL